MMRDVEVVTTILQTYEHSSLERTHSHMSISTSPMCACMYVCVCCCVTMLRGIRGVIIRKWEWVRGEEGNALSLGSAGA